MLEIAVTGLGAIAPNGHSVEEMWTSCLAGISGIKRFHQDSDYFGLDVDFGGAIVDFDFEPYVSRRDRLTYDAADLFATAAAAMALDDAGAAVESYGPERIGAVIGTAAGPQQTISRAAKALAEEGSEVVSPFYVPATTVSFVASLPAMRLALRGPVFAVSGACATASYSIIAASHLLAAGDADLVLAGASDAPRARAAFAGFANMRHALARHSDPAKASRPLDLDRSGFVFAEGAAVLALERVESAVARGARVYGVLAGYGMTSDAGSVIAADANGIARACRLALRRADASAEDMDHVNLHAAGTKQGDLSEAKALHDVLGVRAGEIPVTAPKSLLGHAMGAASGLEIVLLLKTLETGIIPPTINLDTPDPALGLAASTKPLHATIRRALKMSAGLGGLNAALVFESPSNL